MVYLNSHQTKPPLRLLRSGNYELSRSKEQDQLSRHLFLRKFFLKKNALPKIFPKSYAQILSFACHEIQTTQGII